MPELPEVEVIRAGLTPVVTGRTLAQVRVLHPRPVRYHPAGAQGFAAELAGRTMAEPRRRGKYLWIPFDDGDALLVHLGMSGQFRVDLPDAPLLPNTRVQFDFDDDGRQLRFVDQRMFGGLAVTELVPTPDGGPGGLGSGAPLLPVTTAHVARDLLDPFLDRAAAAARIRASRRAVKTLIVDQTIVAGVGNIYADEGLWVARVHGLRHGTELGPRVVARLLEATADVMERALAVGGTSFDSLYVDADGAAGFFARSLAVYGRAGLACRRCGATLRGEVVGGRSHVSCPRCQVRPRHG